MSKQWTIDYLYTGKCKEKLQLANENISLIRLIQSEIRTDAFEHNNGYSGDVELPMSWSRSAMICQSPNDENVSI